MNLCDEVVPTTLFQIASNSFAGECAREREKNIFAEWRILSLSCKDDRNQRTSKIECKLTPHETEQDENVFPRRY